jgi:hypothetical protein
MSERKYLRGDERKAAADQVATAIMECVSTLNILDTFRGDPPKGFEPVKVPFADNVQRAVEAIEPLRSLMTQLLYDLPGLPEDLEPHEWRPAP